MATLSPCLPIQHASGAGTNEPATAAELMKATSTAPIEAAPGCRLLRDDVAVYLEWFKRHLLAPARQRMASHPRGAAAANFMEEALALIYNTLDRQRPTKGKALYEKGLTFTAAGIREPMLHWALAHLTGIYNEEASERKLHYAKACEIMEHGTFPVIVTAIISGERTAHEPDESMRDSLLTDAAKALLKVRDEPGLFEGEDARWYVDMVFAYFENSFENANPGLFSKIYDAPAFPEWARETLKGKWEVCQAWGARGGGFAGSVDKAGWEGFGSHMESARKHLLKAWTLNPKVHYAASKMLSVAGGGNGGPEDTLRLWFDRTIAARFDEQYTYRNYINFIRPRWGGSFEQIAAFGLACAETKRYDTSVPAVLFKALDQIAEDAQSPDARRAFFSMPLIRSAIRSTCEGYITSPKATDTPAYWLSNLALYSWFAGDHATAAGALKRLNGVLDPRVAWEAWKMHTSSALIAAECAVGIAGESRHMTEAAANFEERNYAAAREKFIAIGKKAGPESQALMRSWLTLADIEEKFARGETITLTADENLLQWAHMQGRWRAGPDGSLIAHGSDGEVRIFHRARFGDRVDIQADVTFSDPTPNGQGMHIAFSGRRFDTDHYAWNACGLRTAEGDDAVFGGIYYQFSNCSVKELLSPLKDLSKVHLAVRCANKTISFKVNDWLAFDKESPSRINKAGTAFLYPADGCIGFAYHQFRSEQTVTIQNIKVKRVP